MQFAKKSMLAKKMRCILDTSVLVAGLRSRSGASAVLLRQVATSRVHVAASPAIFLEYESVLKREQHGLKLEYVDGFLAELARYVDPVQIHYHWRPLLADAGDEMVIEAAINGRVDAIVTHNKKDFETAAAKFDIRVLSPAEALGELQREGADR